jgi:flagellar hook-associated protein 1
VSLLTTLGIGRTALRAANAGIEVTGNNVTNASTEGYSAQRLRTATSDPVSRGGLLFGRGVDITGLGRAHDSIVSRQLLASSNSYAEHSTTSRVLTSLEAGIGDLDSGISAALSNFFETLSSATSDPSDTGARLEILGRLESLASAVNDAASSTDTIMDAAGEELSALVATANTDLQALAAVNAEIASSPTISPTLQDRRDQLAASLAESLGGKVDIDARGMATLLVANHAVVSGTEARTLSVSGEGSTLALRLASDGGTINITSGVGGTAGGLVTSIDEAATLDAALDSFATTLAETFNTQHAAGFDADGVAGGAMFSFDATDPAGSLKAAVDDPDDLALAGDSTALAGDGTNLSAMLALRSTAVTSDGKTLEGSINDLVTTLGAKVADADSSAELAQDRFDDMTSLHQSLTGVDLDEEATRLLEYQAAYEAAARVISISSQLLEELMGVVR